MSREKILNEIQSKQQEIKRLSLQVEKLQKQLQELDKMSEIQDNSLKLKEAMEREKSKQVVVKKRVIEPEEKSVVCETTGFKISEDTYQPFGDKMSERSFLSLKELTVNHYRKEQNWVSAGVVYAKSGNKTSANSHSFVTLDITDLKGTLSKLFLYGSAFEEHWKTVVGSVIVFLNPRIIAPETKGQSPSFSINDMYHFLFIGKSAELSYCHGSFKEQECKMPISRKEQYCWKHKGMVLKEARNKRPDVLASTTLTNIGDPKEYQDKRKKVKQAKTFEPMAPLSSKSKQQMMESNTPAARIMRMTEGVEESSQNTPFDAEAIQRMGGNPYAIETTVDEKGR
ncbi:hypothetical protein EDD86DRAFT_278355 [Gorgonomyces haynaldii]|nr:hypothetical protein EDD86DRAFT_278355 [Gorgonomyces haynaldii]